MADLSTCLPLTPDSVRKAHEKIKPYIHKTPVLTSKTLDRIASTPRESGGAAPKLRLFFKCENYQRIGAFKPRGAFHAVLHLIDIHGLDEIKKKGVTTHSSGNHAQALALVAHTFGIPAYIVMPSISTPSKIAGVRNYTENVIFSGSTSQEREAKVTEVMDSTGAILIHPYEHYDIMLGQGTAALELEEQYHDSKRQEGSTDSDCHLNLVITPLGGGGLLSGTCTAFMETPETLVFGAEPMYQGADDGKRGLESSPPTRITKVKTLTIADGLRTPVGELPWKIFTGSSDRKAKYLEGVRSVTEEQIKSAMQLVMERMKVFVEPSACVGLAAILYDEGFRQWVEQHQEGSIWDVGVIFSGGNTTLEAVSGLFGNKTKAKAERQEGKVGIDGKRVVENIAG